MLNKTINILSIKKSLKIPKGQSESVYRGRTDNTMAMHYENNESVPDEGYSREGLCALSSISTFLLQIIQYQILMIKIKGTYQVSCSFA
jgi:hypothetical protein